MLYTLTNQAPLEINTIIIDLNGTLAVNGKVATDVKERINSLQNDYGFQIVLLSGDQRGNGSQIAEELGIKFHKAKSQAEKEQICLEYDCDKLAAIGNARIDIGTFKQAKLAIATLQGEGIHTAIIPHIDIIVPSIANALDLFLDPDTLKATMKL